MNSINPVAWIMVLMLAYGFSKMLRPGGRPYRGNRRLRKLWEKYDQADSAPCHIICGNPSPDGALHCRLEIGHPGWHSHHDPIGWYHDQWAEDDRNIRYGNIPW